MIGLCILCSMPLVVLGQEAQLAISRSIEKTGERQYLVTVDVQKGDLQGYAKLEEMIPESFVASKKETHSANYIFNSGKAKFIWMDLPSASSFEVVYKIIQKQSKVGSYTIPGRLSCVSGDDLLRVRDTSSFEVKAPKDLAQKSSGSAGETSRSRNSDKDEQAGGSGQKNDKGAETSNEAASKEDNEDPPEKEQAGEGKTKDRPGDGDEGKSKGTQGTDKKRSDEPATANSEAQYAIQLGAFGEKKSDAFLDDRYDLNLEKIRSQREGELYKYRFGAFDSQDAADRAEEELRSKGLEGIFVVDLKEEGGSTQEEELASNEGEVSEKGSEGKEEKRERASSSLPDEAYFSVQLGAFGEKKSEAYFKKRYGVSGDKVHFYEEDGLYKYSTGNFVDYEKAKNEKERLRSQGLNGAFIVGFKGGDPVKASVLR